MPVRFRPISGHNDETNTLICAAAAFRPPSPLSERPQLGGVRTSRFRVMKTKSSRIL